MAMSGNQGGGLFAPISREGALVLNNLLFTTGAATVLPGRIYGFFKTEATHAVPDIQFFMRAAPRTRRAAGCARRPRRTPTNIASAPAAVQTTAPPAAGKTAAPTDLPPTPKK